LLEDVLRPGLKLVVCGTAAGHRSAASGCYYAGRGNKFWRTLYAIGLTPRRLTPAECALLPSWGIGLTDLVKGQAGADADIEFDAVGPAFVREKILRFMPLVLCFNGKRAAREFFQKQCVRYGMQGDRIGNTQLFVAPSTSGAANGAWDLRIWQSIADLVQKVEFQEPHNS